MNETIKYNPEASCDSCSKYGAFDLGDEHLCSDCYTERGSCCMEFGGNDLWKDENKQVNPEKKKQGINSSNKK